jgi:hypothetical protein
MSEKQRKRNGLKNQQEKPLLIFETIYSANVIQ